LSRRRPPAGGRGDQGRRAPHSVFIATSDIHLSTSPARRDEPASRSRGPYGRRELGADAEIEFGRGCQPNRCRLPAGRLRGGRGCRREHINIPTSATRPGRVLVLVGQVKRPGRPRRDGERPLPQRPGLARPTPRRPSGRRAAGRGDDQWAGERAGNASLEEVTLRPGPPSSLTWARGSRPSDHRRQPAGQLSHRVRYPAQQGGRRGTPRPRVGIHRTASSRTR
jgi:hypothetical protein